MSGTQNSQPELPPPQKTIEFPMVKFNNGEYSQLVLHEPTVKQVRQADEQLRLGATAHTMKLREIHLVASVADVPVPLVEMLPITVLNQAMQYLNPFLDAYRTIF